MSITVSNYIPQKDSTPITNPWVKVKTTGVTVAESNGVLLTVKIASISRWAINSLKDAFKFVGSTKFPNGIKLVNILTIPCNIYQIIKSMPRLVSGSKTEKADAGLNITAQLGNIGDAIATFSEGIGAVAGLATTALSWTTPLLGAGLVLQTAGMAMTVKSMVETHRFKKVFASEGGLTKKVNDYALEDFRNAIRTIEAKRVAQEQFISKHFGVDENKFADRLVDIESQAQELLDSGDQGKVLEGKKMLYKTVKTLNKRLTVKNRMDGASLAIGTVGYAGIAALFSPATPAVGFAIMAVAGIASIVNFKIQSVMTKRFEKQLGII